MSNVYRLKRQHSEISKAIDAVLEPIEAGEITGCAPLLAAQLHEIAALVTSHLRIEDKEIYPVLMARQETAVSGLATAFREHMGNLANEFAAFSQRYATAAAIAGEEPAFCQATREIFEKLRLRMQREESELYPLMVRASRMAV
ncbi:MAG: hemerythrin domain-containing protein [Defluviicoccus sp.]|nr:hemerythrin domain-containing protein [Defluviicoccus sp.]MDG4610309.1 hemerythrin domain-containing protein [Defluviicoccus sp.]